MNTARIIQNFGSETLEQKGLRLGDQITIGPAQGRKRTIRLNFCKYTIKSSPTFSCEQNGNHLLLPQLGNDEFEFELELCQTNHSKRDEHARYLLRSRSATPFRLNGILCFEAYLERDDRIDLGFNRLTTSSFAPFSSSPSHEVLTHKNILESQLNILIEGETGTGKTFLAKQIHEKSLRSGNFIHLNLSSFSPSLLESELFGHVKGAFTGAITSKKGALALADGGTLFLDEVDSLPWEIQTKLLLFLDDQIVKPVGSEQGFKTSPRLIFASGRPLQEMVQDQKMRKDFFYRLSSGYTIKLTPLRENPSFIEELCHQFETENCISVSPQLISYYKELSWPGNARQLLGHLSKKKVLNKSGHLIYDEHDEELKDEGKKTISLEENIIPLEKLKQDYVRKVYNLTQRRMKKTAVLLQISQGTLRGMLKNNQRATMELKYT